MKSWTQFLLLALIGVTAILHAQTPDIQRTIPLGLPPGQSTQLQLLGGKLEGAFALWNSTGTESKLIGEPHSDKARFELSLPAQASGLVALQLVTSNGVSNFHLTFVDPLPTCESPGTNRSESAALMIEPDTAIDAVLAEEAVDYYTFEAKAGQTVSIETVAHRIGSKADPFVRVYDLQGRELARCDDEGGNSRDARFQFTPPLSGRYLLAVHDVGYSGGPGFFYRLRFGYFPITWFTHPLLPFDFTPKPLGLAVEKPIVRALAPLRLISEIFQTNTTHLVEAEPNGTPDRAQLFGIPAAIHALLAGPGDRDLFKFLAVKDQKLLFQSHTRSLGSPCDLSLRILAQDGKELAASDGSLASEAGVTNTFTQAGTYLLEVKDLSGGGGENLPYLVRIASFSPRFLLRTESFNLEGKPGGEVKLKVTSGRFDWEGPITLSFHPPQPDLKLEGHIIPEKKNESELVLRIPESWEPGKLIHFGLRGEASYKDQAITGTVSTVPALRKNFPFMQHPPAGLDGLFTLLVKKL